MPIGVIAGKRDLPWTRSTAAPWNYGDDSVPDRGRDLLRRHLRAAPARARRGQGLAGSSQARATTSCRPSSTCTPPRWPTNSRPSAARWGAARDPLLLVALARELAGRPPAAGPAVRDDAQPRRAHPGQLPLLHDHRAHAQQDIATIKSAFKESIAEMQEAELLPRRAAPRMAPSIRPSCLRPTPASGRDKDGQPGLVRPRSEAQGKFTKYAEPPGLPNDSP